jgi:hypothetical protein
MDELVFEVTQEPDGGFVAEALGASVITQADTWDELRDNVREARVNGTPLTALRRASTLRAGTAADRPPRHRCGSRNADAVLWSGRWCRPYR